MEGMGESENDREVQVMICSCGAHFAVMWGAAMCPQCGANIILDDEGQGHNKLKP